MKFRKFVRSTQLCCVALVGSSLAWHVQAAYPATKPLAYPALATQWDSQGGLVGYYEPQDIIEAAWLHGGLPAWQTFEAKAGSIATQLEVQCASQSPDFLALKPAFQAMVEAFDKASAINQGPMFDTKITRWLNFQPMRVALVAKTASRQGAIDIEKVGAPAKGLPVLEYLLFAKPNSDLAGITAKRRCEYTQAIVTDIQARAKATIASDKREEPTAQVAYNQLLGGLETFYWDSLKKPLAKLKEPTEKDAPPAFLWTDAEYSTQAIQAVWLGLRPYLIIEHDGLADANQEVIPLWQYLAGLGKLDEADALRKHVLEVDELVAKLHPQPAVSQAEMVEQVEDTFDKLLDWYKHEASKAMKVSVGFSSKDGD